MRVLKCFLKIDMVVVMESAAADIRSNRSTKRVGRIEVKYVSLSKQNIFVSSEILYALLLTADQGRKIWSQLQSIQL